jgi:hypothetical protein
MSTDKTQEEEKNKQVELATAQVQYAIETDHKPEAEVENLKLPRSLRLSPVKISIALIVPGTLSLVLSIVSNSPVLAFIGLGLTFWGALFLFIRPLRYVESSLLISTATSTYTTIDRIAKDLKQKGKSYYIPPYPEEIYLPEHLKGLKDMLIFIPTDSSITMPPIEEILKGKFLLDNQKGICITPPGQYLLTQFEKELRTDITKLELAELCESLPQPIIETFQLAKEIEMKPEEKGVYLKIFDSIFKKLYTEENLKSVYSIGCPLVSAIACAVAKNTGKVVTIQKTRVYPHPDGQTIEVWIRTVEG